MTSRRRPVSAFRVRTTPHFYATPETRRALYLEVAELTAMLHSPKTPVFITYHRRPRWGGGGAPPQPPPPPPPPPPRQFAPVFVGLRPCPPPYFWAYPRDGPEDARPPCPPRPPPPPPPPRQLPPPFPPPGALYEPTAKVCGALEKSTGGCADGPRELFGHSRAM